MSESTIPRSNIFGTITSSGLPAEPKFETNSKTEAGKLLDRIKWIADTQLSRMSAANDWLGIASNQGQNGTGLGMIKYEAQHPDKLTSANILKDWTSPQMPQLPQFPTLPTFLDINETNFKTNIDGLVDGLQNKWLSKFLPANTDTSKYDTLFRDILNGANDASAKAILDNALQVMKSALSSTITGAKSEMDSAIASFKSNVAARKAALDPKLLAAITAANDNTADIAFARARDQVAREGARLEAEAIAEWASRGFTLPGGILTAIQAQQRQSTLDAATKVAIEEAIKAQERQIDLAKLSVEAWLRAFDLELRQDIEAMRAPLEARLHFMDSEFQANREIAKVAFDHLGLRLDFTKFGGEFALKYRVAAIEGMNGLVNAYANLTQNQNEFYIKIADAKRQAMNALIEYHRLALQQADMGFKVALSNNENEIKWANVAGNFIAASVGHHVQSAMAVSQAYAHIAAAAVNGINTVVTQAG